jgi:hypothetical protein
MARPRREAFSTPQLRQLGDVGRDAPGFGLINSSPSKWLSALRVSLARLTRS